MIEKKHKSGLYAIESRQGKRIPERKDPQVAPMAALAAESLWQPALLENALDRRSFIKLMGASLAFAGLTACNVRQPVEKIVPYVRQPEEVVLGKAVSYATAMTLGGYATGLLVESHEGRPTKIDGNPDHPASLGACDAYAQASVLSLYDPERSQTVTHFGEIASWGEFLLDFRKALATHRENGGKGLRILTETVTSPTLADQMKTLLERFPNALWHQYEPVNRDAVREGARLAFGRYVETIYRFDRAEVVLALDADFLAAGPTGVRYAREFMARRQVRSGKTTMNRLYVAECAPTHTGAVADHRLPLPASEVEVFARNLAMALGVTLGASPATGAHPATADRNAPNSVWLAALAADLQQHRGSSLVVAGERQPPVVHAIAHALNQALGNVGNTLVYTDAVEANPTDQLESLRRLVQDMEQGAVEVLLMIGGNPVYNAPADFRFAQHLAKVGLRLHHSLYADETSAHCHWHIPATHYLEEWSDARAFDGTVSIIQPLIEPLYDNKSAHELLAAFSDEPDRRGYDLVRSYWMKHLAAPAANRASTAGPAATAPPAFSEFENQWRRILQLGVVPNTALPEKPVDLTIGFRSAAASGPRPNQESLPGAEPQPAADSQELELVFCPDPAIFDGRFANNGWLQELPKPLTKLTWGNAVLMSPASAARFGLAVAPADVGGQHGQLIADVVELDVQGYQLTAPVFILPGHADKAITIELGYGRTRAGQIGNGVGFNAYALRTSAALWQAQGVRLRKTGERISLACTQAHHQMEGRDPVRAASLSQYQDHPEFARHEADQARSAASLYPGWSYDDYAWGMVIDTSACIGCNACVVACQAENNIPVVGKDEVMRAREMHWLRIDSYYAGEPANPEILLQPVPCMHCENAPCEVVCPVGATTHSDEGINEMTYNRCVGTRYCSNNCPYKVRRFNFFDYADFTTPVVKLQKNPNVTVRSRGVMEKCTYCIQRINQGRIEAEKEDRRVGDGEIVTACQATCPTQAIVFGNLNDESSEVAKRKAEPTNYSLLAELNTAPRTTYLATVRNPNPEIKSTP